MTWEGNTGSGYYICEQNTIHHHKKCHAQCTLEWQKWLKNKRNQPSWHHIKRIINIYNTRGLQILGHGQFECLQKTMEAEGENAKHHRMWQTWRKIIERINATINTFPPEQYPQQLIAEIVYNTVELSTTQVQYTSDIKLKNNWTGSTIDYKKHCRKPFGTYVQVHEQHNNSLMTRTSGTIALCPSRNAQGSYYFLNLHSVTQVICNNWTILPMPTTCTSASNFM